MLALDYALECHSSGTVCATISRSGRYLASAGNDKAVCVWGWKNHNYLQSWDTYFRAEALCFGRLGEHLLAVGSPSGNVKIFDLHKQSPEATLYGHAGPVRTISQLTAFLWATGSVDCAVRVYDTRQRHDRAAFVMKEHTKTVNSVSCSPDSQWVISTSDDCTVKIWDMKSGKVLRTIKEHSAPVTCAQTHPQQYLMATSSLDKTVRFWDLETYECVSQSDTAAGPVNSIMFHPDGSCLMAAGQKSLRFLGWEPARTFHSCVRDDNGCGILSMGVQSVSDLQICLSTDKDGNGLRVYSVDIQSLRPFSPTSELQSENNSFENEEHSSEHDTVSSLQNEKSVALNRGKMRRSFTGKAACLEADDSCESESQSTSSTEQSPVHHISTLTSKMHLNTTTTLKGDTNANEDKKTSREKRLDMRRAEPSSSAVTKSINVDIPPGEAFKSKPKVSRSPPVEIYAASQNETSLLPPKPDDCFGKTYTVVMNDNVPPVPPHPARRSPIVTRKCTSAVKKANISRETSIDEPSFNSTNTSITSMPSSTPIGTTWKGKGSKMMATVQPQRVTGPSAMPKQVEKVPPFRLAPQNTTVTYSDQGRANSQTNLNVEDFLPTASSVSPGASTSARDCVEAVSRFGHKMPTIMTHRSKEVRFIFEIWKREGAKKAMHQAVLSNDQSLILEILKIFNSRGNAWTLELSTLFLPQIRKLLETNLVANAEVASESIRAILRVAGPLIKNNIARPPSIGVDVNMERRTEKCRTCVVELQNINESLKMKSSDVSTFVYKELGMQLMQFLQ